MPMHVNGYTLFIIKKRIRKNIITLIMSTEDYIYCKDCYKLYNIYIFIPLYYTVILCKFMRGCAVKLIALTPRKNFVKQKAMQ